MLDTLVIVAYITAVTARSLSSLPVLMSPKLDTLNQYMTVIAIGG